MATWLVLDCNNLCYRAFYAMGRLSHEGKATGALYGVFRDILALRDVHATDHVAFCFDHGKSIRTAVYPEYKANRHKNMTEEEEEAHESIKEQIDLLKTQYLKEIGFRNIFYKKGYEADDMIASACLNLNEDDEAIIVSTDKDMYQLLSKRVHIWNPKVGKMITRKSFIREYGIKPKQWVDVRSISGCSTDNIKGIAGVGDKTAIKFILGTLKPDCKLYDKIRLNFAIRRENEPIVKLPFRSTPKVELVQERISESAWRALMEKLGMRSITKMKRGNKRGFEK